MPTNSEGERGALRTGDEREKNGEEVPLRLWGLGERRELSQRGPGRYADVSF